MELLYLKSSIFFAESLGLLFLPTKNLFEKNYAIKLIPIMKFIILLKKINNFSFRSICSKYFAENSEGINYDVFLFRS